jgi:hypothetical protein
VTGVQTCALPIFTIFGKLVHYFVARWPMTARSLTRAKEKDPVGKIKIETGYKEFRCIREQEYGS